MEADTISQAEQIAEKQKRIGTVQIEEVAKAVHRAADELKPQMPKAAELVHASASRLEHGASALRDRGVGELMSEVNDVARKQPLALLAGAIAAGFAISRFLKSSADRSAEGG